MNFDKNRFMVALGAKYLERHIDDEKFWSDLIRKNINPMLKEVHPLLLSEYFDNNKSFQDIFVTDHLNKIKTMVEGNEDLLVKLKQKAELSLMSFEWSWIEEWWKKDHIELLSVVENHVKSEEFKKYLTSQISALAKKVKNSF